MITHLKLSNFKGIKNFESEFDELCIIAGTNNSGKSSILQGIHFSIMIAAASREFDALGKTINEQYLYYSPSGSLARLRHNEAYAVASKKTSSLILRTDMADCEDVSITIRKARNKGNLSASLNCNPEINVFANALTSSSNLYSMYVPGISGITTHEQYVTEPELRPAVARGDANMYIRNILYRLQQNGEIEKLNEHLNNFFPNRNVRVNFDISKDIDISINVTNQKPHMSDIPIEQCGTGMLQVIQLFAYVLYFKPKLLLLDEPDEHLHPDNQKKLARTLKILSKNGVQIFISTHSSFLIREMALEAKLIWLKNGKIEEMNEDLHIFNILKDIGALSDLDNCLNGKYKNVILTEDQKKTYIEKLLPSNSQTCVLSYGGCSHLEAAILFGKIIKRFSPRCNVIIHVDRDFMTDDEANYIKGKISSKNLSHFITDGSDIESYFTSISHIASSFGKSNEFVESWINEIINNNYEYFLERFKNKREEAKKSKYYREASPGILPPNYEDLLTDGNIGINNVTGKDLLCKIRETYKAKCPEVTHFPLYRLVPEATSLTSLLV